MSQFCSEKIHHDTDSHLCLNFTEIGRRGVHEPMRCFSDKMRFSRCNFASIWHRAPKFCAGACHGSRRLPIKSDPCVRNYSELDGTRRASVDDYVSACGDLDLWPLTLKATQHIRTQIHTCMWPKLSEISFIDFWDMVFTRFSGRTDSRTHSRTYRPIYIYATILTCAQKRTSSQLSLPHGTVN